MSLSPLRQPDFALQDGFWVSSGILDIESISSKFSVIRVVSTVEVMRNIFYGGNPSLLMVHPLDETEALFKVID